MAGHNESEKKSSDAVNDLQTFRAENLQSNMKVIYYSRTFLSIIGGVIAGILGFTGLTGFVFYFLVMAITSVALIAKAKFSIHTYFDSWNRVVFDGFLGGLMSFVLFWTGFSIPLGSLIKDLFLLVVLCCYAALAAVPSYLTVWLRSKTKHIKWQN